MPRRVVVTGMNMITALGLDRESSWAGLLAGRSGVGPITLFTPDPGQTAIAAELPAGFAARVSSLCSRRLQRQMSPPAQSRPTWSRWTATRPSGAVSSSDWPTRGTPPRTTTSFGS
jgi:3-oxoacyl-(acyl-carrier-protein) synthase